MTAQKKPPFDMVVVGATGDLARRKLLPALYILHKLGEISSDGRIFAAARSAGDRANYLEHAGASARRHIEDDDLDDEAWKRFVDCLHPVQMSATDPDTYGELRQMLAGAEERERIFYLAVSPRLYGDISRAIAKADLITARTRIVLEKPIGHDLASASAINAAVGEAFAEHQIFRIDHYLGKETVQNLMALRFGNALYEPMWRCEHIDHVQITVAETLGVEGRGGYYDHTGALRDMVQNHILQLLCLVAMEPPASLDADAIRDEKIKVMRSLRPIAAADVAAKTVRGQYREGAIGGQSVPAYRDEPDVDEEAGTETFVALKAEIDNWRWAGVPFYLRTGKRMSQRLSEIVIQFRAVPHVLFDPAAGELKANRLVIRLQPDESIRLSMMTKAPGARMKLRREFLNLNLADRPGERTPLAYERLLLDVVRGVPTLFIHRQEVEAAWRWIDRILEGWQERGERPRSYGAGSWGPSESITLIVKDGHIWYEQEV